MKHESEMKQEMANQIQESLDGRLGPMEEDMNETKEMIDQMYQLMSTSNGQSQGQNQNRYGQNRNNGGKS